MSAAEAVKDPDGRNLAFPSRSGAALLTRSLFERNTKPEKENTETAPIITHPKFEKWDKMALQIAPEEQPCFSFFRFV